MIAIENPNSKAVKAIYCHWDGYLEHNGAILNEHYSASPKVNNLIALGDMSSLRAEIGDKHAFSQFELPKDEVEAFKKLTENMCTFYGRDRGENAPYKRFDTAKEAVTHYDHCGAEYFYLFRYDEDQQAGKWFYKKGSAGAWKRLATALSKTKEEEFA
jgi:hypothetical protein